MTELADKFKMANDARARWRKADYTWKGLLKHSQSSVPTHSWDGWVIVQDGCTSYAVEAATGRRYGTPKPADEVAYKVEGRKATLQDYWRADVETGRLRSDEELLACGALVCAPGQPEYHAAHLPLRYEDGTQTLKGLHCAENPDVLDALVNSRVSVPDTVAMFDGGVWLKALDYFPPNSKPIISYVNSIFEGDANFTQVEFQDAKFDSTSFLQQFGFRGIVAGDVSFDGCLFLESAVLSIDCRLASFYRTVFAGIAWLNGRIPGAVFSLATFYGEARFKDVKFIGRANFQGAQFKSDANFAGATFEGAAIFSGHKSGSMKIFDRLGNKSITSYDAVKHERMALSAAQEIDVVTFAGNGDFSDAIFSDVADFLGVTVLGQAIFSRAKFLKRASFANAHFCREAHFGGAAFSETASFTGASFDYRISFKAARFQGVTYLNKIKSFPQKCWLWQSAFSKAIFENTLDWSENQLAHFAIFDGAIIKGNIEIENSGETSTSDIFISERNQAMALPRLNLQDVNDALVQEGKPQITKEQLEQKLAAQRFERLTSLERGCRVLKQEMAKQSDKQREQLFYKFELLSRRAQKNIRIDEWIFSFLYHKAADYGASITRPLASIVALFFLLAAVVGGWAYAIGLVGYGPHQTNPEQAVWDVLDFCWTNTLKPLSVLAMDLTSGNTVVSALVSQKHGTGFWVRLIATIQSLLVVVLAFVFGLAVRRRFQMN